MWLLQGAVDKCSNKTSVPAVYFSKQVQHLPHDIRSAICSSMLIDKAQQHAERYSAAACWEPKCGNMLRDKVPYMQRNDVQQYAKRQRAASC